MLGNPSSPGAKQLRKLRLVCRSRDHVGREVEPMLLLQRAKSHDGFLNLEALCGHARPDEPLRGGECVVQRPDPRLLPIRRVLPAVRSTMLVVGDPRRHRDPVPLVQTRNRFTHLAGIREEENANEDIPMLMAQRETAVEPYPAREDRIQERTTEVTFRTSGKFNELGQEYKRLAEAKGGLTEKPKNVRVTPPKVQVLETSAYDPKGIVGISTKTKYENQSKYDSTSIHNHTNLCGDTARATSCLLYTSPSPRD